MRKLESQAVQQYANLVDLEKHVAQKKPLIAKLDFDTAENGRRQGCCMIRAREP